MLEPLPSFQKSLIKPHSTIIIGLSGGPDSIYLLHHLASLQQELNLTLIAAHLDHEWQESSKVAVQICQEHCKALHIPLIVKKLSDLNFQTKWNGSQEELGRNMRRHFFNMVVQEYRADAIALAHHLQDQQETFFIRLIRGSTLAGLIGMKDKDHLYIRPMLNCSKKEIIEYLHHHGITYYTDPTNAHDTYLRNRIRNHVIPALQNTDERFEKKLQSSMEQLAQTEDFLEQHTTTLYKSLKSSQGVFIPTFLQMHSIMQQRILLRMLIEEDLTFCPSQKFFKEIMRFLEKSSAKQHKIHEDWIIKKSKTHFVMTKTKKNDKNL